MAKTNRRPVDKLERKQRLESRRNQHQRAGRIAPQNWDVFLDDGLVNDEDYINEAMSEAEAA